MNGRFDWFNTFKIQAEIGINVGSDVQFYHT